MKYKALAVVCAALIALSSVSAASAQTIQSQSVSAEAVPSDCPNVKSVTPTLSGFKLTWDAYKGAVKYRVFIKNGTSWKGIGDTASLSFEHKNLKNNTAYTYTVRALDKNGKFMSRYYTTGWTHTFYSTPSITAVQGSTEGLKISWNKIEGVNSYRLYVKNGSSWQRILDTKSNSYVDANAEPGKTYAYTVRCMSDDNKTFLSHYTSGKSGTYVLTPHITSIQNVANGAKISWDKCAGAAKYRVFVKNSSGWKGLGNTASLSFEHKNLISNASYTYTVRALNSDGSFASAYDVEGVKNTFYAVPQIKTVESVNGGLKVSWTPLSGINNYRIYVKEGGSWKRITDTPSTSYTDANVSSGKSYIYTVRCMSDDSKKFLSHYSTSGKAGTYVQAPAVTKLENTATGTKLTWNKSAGAAKYRVFVKNGTSWKGIGDTTATSFEYKNLASGTDYTYTVRALNGSGSFVSGYNATGWTFRFYAPPAVTSVTSVSNGMKVKWNAMNGVAGCRVYRRNFDGTWSPLADVNGTEYVDTSVPANTLYTYTLRYLNEKGVSISNHVTNTKFYYNKSLANGIINYKGVAYNFKNGYLQSGFVTVNGKTYYYDSNGVMQKNGVVGSDKDGYRYADSSGVVDSKYCGVVTKNGTTFNVINGTATKVKTESDKTLSRAIKEVNKCTNRNMTKEQKLKAAFDYMKKAYVERVPRATYHGKDWHIIYANDILEDGMGDCFSYGAAFAFMAKAIGYTTAYACNSGGHGWAEVDGRIYDPEWSRHRTAYTYFGMSYNAPCDVPYKSAISAGEWWMHVKV